MSDGQTTRKIIELLKHRHSGPEWATFVELPTATGSAGNYRRIDFLAFNVWPSKNYLRIAYEVKASRSDFHRELDNPKKRMVAEHVANECYFAMPAGLVKVDEIPEGWGLIELIKNGLRIKKRAMQRNNGELPIWFIAAMARQASAPPSTLPVAAWLRAGQEIDEATLIRLANENTKKRLRAAEENAVERFKKSWRYESLKELKTVIQDKLGYGYADASTLAKWLEITVNGDVADLEKKRKNALRQLAAMRRGMKILNESMVIMAREIE